MFNCRDCGKSVPDHKKLIHAKLCKGKSSLSSSAGKRRGKKAKMDSSNKYPDISEESDSLVQPSPSVNVKKRKVEVDMAKRKNIEDSDDSYGTDNATETDQDHGATSSGQFGASSTPGKTGAMSSTYTDNKDSDSDDTDSDLSESET